MKLKKWNNNQRVMNERERDCVSLQMKKTQRWSGKESKKRRKSHIRWKDLTSDTLVRRKIWEKKKKKCKCSMKWISTGACRKWSKKKKKKRQKWNNVRKSMRNRDEKLSGDDDTLYLDVTDKSSFSFFFSSKFSNRDHWHGDCSWWWHLLQHH